MKKRKLKSETFQCACGHTMKGRKITLDSKDVFVCPVCRRKHYVDAEYIEWDKANISRNTH